MSNWPIFSGPVSSVFESNHRPIDHRHSLGIEQNNPGIQAYTKDENNTHKQRTRFSTHLNLFIVLIGNSNVSFLIFV